MAMALHTYAELCTVKATDLVKIPDGLEMTTAAALPLVTLTGDTLIRVGANVQPDQTVLITGALGSVGRSAVFVASQIGARVIAGVRGKRLDAARQLPGVSEAIAIDDDAEIDRLGPLDSVADTIGGKLADKFLAKVIEAFQQVAQQARKNYRRVFGTTILPGGYPPEQVEQHRLVNTWLREQGQQWFDAIFDFATPLASPDDEAVLQMAYDSGDGIHPNDEGYRLMAEAVDINQLTGNPGREA